MTVDEVAELARRELGYERLRPGQGEGVEAVVAGRDALVVMPTGSGKSAIYQLAGLVLEGPTVVVSPLLALQRDQIESIEESGVADAAAVSSAVTETEREEALEEAEDGGLEFLFLAPEQFANEETLARVRAAEPSLFVVDEAHSISEWGHDFRPEYLQLGEVAEQIGRPPILALTATAAPPVRDEIVARLGLREPALVVRGFDRPNIWLGVETFTDARAKTEAIVDAVESAAKPGIVYAATRKRADELAALIAERGPTAASYHSGLGKRKREQTQEDFMDDRLDVIVATIAFGMGVDKPNVRFVYHSEISESVDSYYQEIGRGGRDGESARACLFYRAEDVGLRKFFASSSDDETRRAYERSRVDMIRAYAELRDCRRRFVLEYFGESLPEPCGNCDNCDAGLSDDEMDGPFALGTRVAHAKWGEGTVQRYEADKMVVLFDREGYKTLDVELVTGGSLLARV